MSHVDYDFFLVINVQLTKYFYNNGNSTYDIEIISFLVYKIDLINK